ncbi:MAG: hypothetical protein WCV91_00875 [Candidatus Margulisiibacteriota bacterium]
MKKLIISLIALFLFTFASYGVSIWTPMELDAKAQKNVNFIVYYNNSDDLIQTEMSFNYKLEKQTASPKGYIPNLSIVRVSTDQMPGINPENSYTMWISGNGGAAKVEGAQIGKVSPAISTGSYNKKLKLESGNYLAYPSGIKGKENKLSWSSVPGATSYRIYRRVGGLYQRVGIVKEATFEDANVEKGNIYNYIVVAVADVGGVEKRSGHSAEISLLATSTSVAAKVTPIEPIEAPINVVKVEPTEVKPTEIVNNKGPEISATIDGNKTKNGLVVNSKPKISISLKDENGIKNVVIIVDKNRSKIKTASVVGAMNVDASSVVTSFSPKMEIELEPGIHDIEIEAEDMQGKKSTLTISGVKVFDKAELQGIAINYPNPFKPGIQSTTINYKLTKDADVKLMIYDLTGKMVYTQAFSAGNNGGKIGENEPTWDGKSFTGSVLSNGVYPYFITVEGKVIGAGEISIYQ